MFYILCEPSAIMSIVTAVVHSFIFEKKKKKKREEDQLLILIVHRRCDTLIHCYHNTRYRVHDKSSGKDIVIIFLFI